MEVFAESVRLQSPEGSEVESHGGWQSTRLAEYLIWLTCNTRWQPAVVSQFVITKHKQRSATWTLVSLFGHVRCYECIKVSALMMLHHSAPDTEGTMNEPLMLHHCVFHDLGFDWVEWMECAADSFALLDFWLRKHVFPDTII